MLFFFFFSSRRRHTRFDCDWSSDVCSSDLREYCCDEAVEQYSPQYDRDGQADGRGRLSKGGRSEEHTSELQSQSNLVCRLLLEKKKATDRRPFAFSSRPSMEDLCTLASAAH